MDVIENGVSDVASIVATVDEARDPLEVRLEAAEAEIRALKAERGGESGRKTVSCLSAVGKPGVAESAGALDLALVGLSVEQRIAVKSEMLRAGLLR